MPFQRPSRAAVVAVMPILLLAAAEASLLQPAGCAPNSQFALVRSLDRGTPRIDRYQWQTCDKAYVRGHFYSNHAPGLAFVALPVYAALHAAGVVAERPPSVQSYLAGRDDTRRSLWPLVLAGVVLPGAALLVLARRFADGAEPGVGTLAAVALGVATLLLPLSTVYFSHDLAALLGFGAFLLVCGRRRSPSWAAAVGGGLLAGYAVATEYPLGLVAAALALCLALRRQGGALAAFLAGCAVGVLPLLAYNLWAFHSAFHVSYADQVINQGQTGHDTIGRQSAGFFGITRPKLHVALQLLLLRRGLLVETPLVAAAVAGAVVLALRGRRIEGLLPLVLLAAFLTYDSGYYIPFGGDGPGPRLLIPALPFLAAGLAVAWRRFPVTTHALAAVSAVTMGAANATEVYLGNDDTGNWFRDVVHGRFTEGLPSFGGVAGWPAVLPFAVLLALAAAVALRTLPRPRVAARDAAAATGAVAAWLLLLGAAPRILDAGGTGRDLGLLLLLAAAAVTAVRAHRRPWALAAGLPLLVLLVPSWERQVPVLVGVAAVCLAAQAALAPAARGLAARA